MYTPTFWVGGGVACTIIPPTFQRKDNLTFDIYCKEIDNFLTVNLLRMSKLARSLHSLAHKCILKLDLCGFASTHLYSERWGKMENETNIM